MRMGTKFRISVQKIRDHDTHPGAHPVSNAKKNATDHTLKLFPRFSCHTHTLTLPSARCPPAPRARGTASNASKKRAMVHHVISPFYGSVQQGGCEKSWCLEVSFSSTNHTAIVHLTRSVRDSAFSDFVRFWPWCSMYLICDQMRQCDMSFEPGGMD